MGNYVPVPEIGLAARAERPAIGGNSAREYQRPYHWPAIFSTKRVGAQFGLVARDNRDVALSFPGQRTRSLAHHRSV